MSDEKDLARAIGARTNKLSEHVVNQHFQQWSDSAVLYDDAARQKCLEDAVFHLQHFVASLQMQRASLFLDYVVWVQQLLATYDIPASELVQYLTLVKKTLLVEFPAWQEQELISEYFDPTLALLRREPLPVETHLRDGTVTDSLAKRFLELLLEGNRIVAANAVLSAVENGIPIKDIYINVFQPVQYEIGRLWHRGELSVAQEHFCTAVTQWVMSRLYPAVFVGGTSGGRVVAACVAGDLHEIGLRMVADLLELDGWNTFYVGANAPIAAIVDLVARERAQILALSATMGVHLPPLQRTIELLRQDSQFKHVKILVGGRPFLIEPALVQSVGADAMATNADEALLVARKIVNTSD